MSFPEKVKIVEVGPRDGLQNQPKRVSTQVKIELINRLAKCGLTSIETGSFVSSVAMPQMADTADVLAGIERVTGVNYTVLTPNLKGLDAALACGVNEIAVFASASETFSQKNINCSIDESLDRFNPVFTKAAAAGVRVRGYVSCVLGCPYEGDVATSAVQRVSRALFDKGCYEISLGDTIGRGTPKSAREMVSVVAGDIPKPNLAVHFHDTYGQALANIYAVLDLGIEVIDSAIAGLGGCPYAKGATGNVATEDVLYMLHGMGIETGVDLQKIIETGHFISHAIGQPPSSRVSQAFSQTFSQAFS